jgi:hypothetical protein
MNITKYAVVISQLKQSQMSSAFFRSTNYALLRMAFENRARAPTVDELCSAA